MLLGRSGAGKGYLATAALKWNGSGIFLKHPDMLMDLRASYDAGRTQELITRWQDCEMLVLDEFGLSGGGRDEEPMLYQVLADRYDHRRPTIITSNLEIGALREVLGFRLLNRLGE
ncbi:ATP-binding protein [Chthoniobacter flavus]|uniref:ATP-binding protein n=1 Tax=Chthoniobacter flavus TaxID=191863 RepID=UPI002351C32F|nr:ATP-binding protein [Chthoniobacter flavus]